MPPTRRSEPAPLPTSPFAFFAENDLLRQWLRALNTILAAYCVAMMSLLSSGDSCSGQKTSFYCDPRVGITQFGLVIRNLHSVLAIYCGFCAWCLSSARRCFVLLNVATLSTSGVAMVSLGISQCIVAAQRTDAVATALVGVQLMVLGVVTSVGGGYGGWTYDRRRMTEIRVVVDVLRVIEQ